MPTQDDKKPTIYQIPNLRVSKPLGWWAQRRVDRLDVTLAGLRAKLAATHETLKLVAEGSAVPGALAYDLRDLPRLIAELEEEKRQIVERRGR